jgi:hypothetical protein
MATMIEEHTTEEQYSVVHFLWPVGLDTTDLHKEMFPSLSWEVFVA